MKNYSFLFLLIGGLFLIGCGDAKTEESPSATDETPTPETTAPALAAADMDYDEWAGELCVCMTPMIDFQSKMIDVMTKEGEAGLASLETEAIQIQTDGEACMDVLEKKYGLVQGPESEDKAMAALEKNCPKFIAMMEATAPPQGFGGGPAEK